MPRRKLVAGNWKMNGVGTALMECESLCASHPSPAVEIVVCPPATLLSRMAETVADSRVALGGQYCHARDSGPHTGDISAPMLADAGASYVIVGHSERRADHGESDDDIRAQANAATAAGLVPIVCVGETLAQYEAGLTLSVTGTQLAGCLPDSASENLIVAYEPVWAIGTGKVPTSSQIGKVHDALRTIVTKRLGEVGKAIRLLYGGSVKASNASEIFAIDNVDGALVGGASLTAADFSPIVTALEAS